MTTKTIIYLDVDGVINAYDGMLKTPKEGHGGWDEWDSRVAMGFTICFSHELLRELERLAERDDVEVRWLTTWREHAAAELCTALDLQGAKWAVTPDDHQNLDHWGWWKLHALQRDWDGESRVVWVDDDLKYDSGAQRWLSQQDSDKVLEISPETHLGLTRVELEAIKKFIDAPVT